MTREGIIKHKKVFDAWFAGEEIEFFHKSFRKWCVADNPVFSHDIQYRIKPRPPKFVKGDFVKAIHGGLLYLLVLGDIDYGIGNQNILYPQFSGVVVKFDSTGYGGQYTLGEYSETWSASAFLKANNPLK